MFNQKGFILPPFLVIATIIIGSVLIVQDAVKKGYVEISSPSTEQVETATPNPEPTLLPIPSVQPTKKPAAAPTTNTQQKVNITQITHDGSRTGPIVDYYSYCDNKTIKVYENERIPFTTKAGKQVYSTKGDIDCYNRDLARINQPLLPAPTYDSGYNPPTLITCVVNYPCTGASNTYQLEQATCTSWQQQAINLCNSTSRMDSITQDGIKQMQDISNTKIKVVLPPSPTPLQVPVGYGYR